MKNKIQALILAPLLLSGAGLCPGLRAEESDRSYVHAGPAMGWLDSDAGSDRLAGVSVKGQFHLFEFLVFDAAVSADYTWLKSTDSGDLERQDSNVDFVVGGTLLGILNPYVTAGVSYDKFDALAYTGSNGWDPGVALGAGVEITLVPKLLSLTPSVRYVNGDKIDTVTYALDTEVHFTLFAVGARVAYEDNQNYSGGLTTAVVYVGLRF